MDKEFWEIVGNGKPPGSVLKETIAFFRHDINKRAKTTQPNLSPRSSTQQNVKKCLENQKSLEAEAQVGQWLDCRARITSKELAPIHSVKNGILQNAGSTSQRMDVSALTHTARLTNSLAKSLKRMVTKVQWLY